MVTKDLLFNLSLLLAASFVANLIDVSVSFSSRSRKLLLGVLFGLIAILGMTFPYTLQKGLIFDGRSIVLSLATLFYGSVVGLISGLMALIYRIYIGGAGVYVGSLTIIVSITLGLIFHKLFITRNRHLDNKTLLLFNFLVNNIVLLLMLLLPGALSSQTIYKIGFAFGVVYPIVGFVISKLIQHHFDLKEANIKVKDSQEKFAKIFNNSSNPLLVIDAVNFRIADLNDAFKFLTGYDKEDILNKSIIEVNLFRQSDFQDIISPRLKTGVLIRGNEFKIKAKDGNLIDVLLNSSLIKLTVGEFYLFSFFDLRPQKQAIKEILKLTRVYSLLSEVNQLIVRTKDKEELLKNICELSVRVGNFKLVWIGKINPEKNKVEIVYSSGSGNEYLKNLDIRLDDEKMSSCQTVQCFRTGKCQVILNWETDSRVENIREFALKYGIKSSTSFPIIVFNELIYTINFYSEELNFFDSPEITLLDEVSKDISYALESIENEERRKRAEANLRENVRFLSTLINNLPGFIYRCLNDKNWTMEYLSPQVEEITGYKVDDFLFNKNLAFNDIIHPDYRDLLWNKWQELLPKKEVFEFEYPIITKSGEIRWVWERGRGIYNEKDEVIFLEGFITDVTEKVLFKQQILEINEKLKLLVEGIPYFFFYTHDREGRINYISPSVERITGYKVEEWVGTKHWFLTDNPINEKAKMNTRKVLSGEKGEFPIYIEIYHKNGEKIILEIYEMPYYKEGKIVGLHGVARDVTIEKKYQERLIRSEERFRKLFEDHSAVKLIVDPETGQIFDANNSALKFYGYTIEELKSMKISDINILGVEGVKKEMQKVVSGEKNYFELKHRLKDGTIKDVAVFSSTVEIDGKIYLHSIIHDISEIKKLQAELLSEKKKFQQLFDNSPLPIAIIDREEKIQVANDPFIKFFEVQTTSIIGKKFAEICCQEDMLSLHQNFINLIFKGDKRIQETYLKKMDGSLAYVQIMGVPIFLDAEIIGAFIIVIDLTKIKEAEESQRVAKEMAELASKMKDTFIANISHEIRTPLNAILGYTSLLRDISENLFDEETKSYFDIIQSAGNRLMRTIDMIMNYSRIVAGDLPLNKEKLNLTNIVRDLCDEFRYTAEIKNLEFEFSNECGEVYIYADNYCTTQAIANIIDNAVKYTKRGSIKVKLKRDENQRLILEVEDTGIGISKKYQERIFEPYTQQELGWNRPYEGVGLGLALVKNYLVLNGMDITFKSEEGKGSTFYIHFNETEVRE